MMTLQQRRRVLPLAVAVYLLAAACAGNRAPAQIAGNVAHNADLVITAVDNLQKLIASNEAAGRIPRNQAVTAMEAIGRSLDASKKAGAYLDKLVKLQPGSVEGDSIVKQIQDALALASSDAALALVPIGDEVIRSQIGKLVAEVNKAIGQVNGIILSLRRTS